MSLPFAAVGEDSLVTGFSMENFLPPPGSPPRPKRNRSPSSRLFNNFSPLVSIPFSPVQRWVAVSWVGPVFVPLGDDFFALHWLSPSPEPFSLLFLFRAADERFLPSSSSGLLRCIPSGRRGAPLPFEMECQEMLFLAGSKHCVLLSFFPPASRDDSPGEMLNLFSS